MYLEHGYDGVPKRVEVTAVVGRAAQLAAEYLHPQKGEDEYEEKEQEQQGEDRLDGVHERADQVSQTAPISAKEKLKINLKARACFMYI